MGIFFTNLEMMGRGTENSMVLAACQLTKQDTWWSVTMGITEFRCLNLAESLWQSLERKGEEMESLVMDQCQQQFLVMVG